MKAIRLNKVNYKNGNEHIYDFGENAVLYKTVIDKDDKEKETVLRPYVRHSKNYIFFEYVIKINNKKHVYKVHKLMMEYFNLSKKQCLEKGYLLPYDKEVFESLKRCDKAKNKKLSEAERIERMNDWCMRFHDRYDLVNNVKRDDELNQYHYKVDNVEYLKYMFGFVPFVPDVNRLKLMVGKLNRDKTLADYYFNIYIPSLCNDDRLYYTYEEYAKEQEIIKRKEETKRYYQTEEGKSELERIRLEREKERQETEDNLKQWYVNPITNKLEEEVDEQFERCDTAIRICCNGGYVDSMESFFEMAIKNDFIEEEDVEYIMNNDALQNRLKQYNVYSTTRSERVEVNSDNRCYSDYVDRYYSIKENNYNVLDNIDTEGFRH